jgi:hypothetical protein
VEPTQRQFKDFSTDPIVKYIYSNTGHITGDPYRIGDSVSHQGDDLGLELVDAFQAPDDTSEAISGHLAALSGNRTPYPLKTKFASHEHRWRRWTLGSA